MLRTSEHDSIIKTYPYQTTRNRERRYTNCNKAQTHQKTSTISIKTTGKFKSQNTTGTSTQHHQQGTTPPNYGWKWENKPAESWRGMYANYLKLNDYDIRLAPFYSLYSGDIYSGSFMVVGAGGFYWSTTAASSSGAYSFDFYSPNVYPSVSNVESLGFSIRCLAR